MIKKIFILILFISCVVTAQTADELFSKANTLYKNGEYEKAISIYEQIENSDKISSELYYNLGNCYYKINKIAPTIYNYEKALKLSPNDNDIKNNLALAKRLTLDRIEVLPKTIIQQINENFLQKLSYNNWGILSIVFSILTAVLFLFFYFSVSSSKKRGLFTFSIISFVLLIVTTSVALNQFNRVKNTIEGIIFADEVDVQNEPTNNADEIFIIHEGLKVEIIDEVDEWKKIKLADGKIGWILSEKIKEI